MTNEEEEISCFDLPETTRREIIQKISAMASSIRGDWTDPRSECRHIWRLCEKLIEMESQVENLINAGNSKRNKQKS